jgi:hypothetical protein
VEAGEQVHDHLAVAGVEVAGGLVGEDHARRARQGAGDRHALLLAAGQLRRQMLGARAEADGLKVPLDRVLALVSRHSQRSERGLDVLGGGQRRDQVELLEDEAQRPQPQLREGAVSEPLQRLALEADRAAARPIERP